MVWVLSGAVASEEDTERLELAMLSDWSESQVKAAATVVSNEGLCTKRAPNKTERADNAALAVEGTTPVLQLFHEFKLKHAHGTVPTVAARVSSAEAYFRVELLAAPYVLSADSINDLAVEAMTQDPPAGWEEIIDSRDTAAIQKLLTQGRHKSIAEGARKIGQRLGNLRLARRNWAESFGFREIK